MKKDYQEQLQQLLHARSKVNNDLAMTLMTSVLGYTVQEAFLKLKLQKVSIWIYRIEFGEVSIIYNCSHSNFGHYYIRRYFEYQGERLGERKRNKFFGEKVKLYDLPIDKIEALVGEDRRLVAAFIQDYYP